MLYSKLYHVSNTILYVWNFQLLVMALITMSVFLRTEMHHDTIVDGGIYTGALFFSVIMVMFNGLSELSLTTIKLPNFYKQRDLLFYPSWAYSLPNWILKIPITFIEVALWVGITYYGIGFDPNIERLENTRVCSFCFCHYSVPSQNNYKNAVGFSSNSWCFY